MVYLNTELGTNSYVNSSLKTSGTSMTNNNKTDSSSFQSALDGASDSDTSTIDPNIVEINKETDPDERSADLKLYQNLKRSGVNFSIQSFDDVKQGLVTFPPVSAPGKIRNAISNILDAEENQGANIGGQLLFNFQNFIGNTNSDLNSLDTYKEFGSYMSNSLDVLLKNGDISQSDYNVGQNITKQLQNLTL
ncbi:hypothetical protein [Sporolactobacillus pectinivorans]|uniref:hypothetical protein n=1 Tax=Sporolactobacillus pectinivorans TaxID=1591408 RepID=UPI000C269CA0|nr:hypothetical protein [Sporolactobacillus pectinivorans]